MDKIREEIINGFDFFNLMYISQRLRRRVNKEAVSSLKKYNLTGFHLLYIILLARSKEEGLTLKELSDITSFDKANTSRVVNDLESKGYLERAEHKSGEKKYKVYLTQAGREVGEAIEEKSRMFTAKLIEDLDNADARTLLSLIDVMAERARKKSGKEGI